MGACRRHEIQPSVLSQDTQKVPAATLEITAGDGSQVRSTAPAPKTLSR
jgi:hypothetical protein